MKNAVFWDVSPCGSCKNLCFGGTYHPIIRVTIIGRLVTLAVTSNRNTLRRYTIAVVVVVAPVVSAAVLAAAAAVAAAAVVVVAAAVIVVVVVVAIVVLYFFVACFGF
jgi:hypothetical protein